MTQINEALVSFCEEQALRAQELPAFAHVNIQGIKNDVSSLLDLIGRGHFFEEYTIHNISHINRMLSIADWIIDSESKGYLSPADYMIITLSIYMHDLGMLVTVKEFENRKHSDFDSFKESFIRSNSDAEDYVANLIKIYPDQNERERYLYQEFVRGNHAKRIRNWINGDTSNDFGYCHRQIEIVQKILAGIPDSIRNDVALICESHHLPDISDTDTFEISKPYGHSEREYANLQYAAIVLRTVDLLHITGDRAPTIQLKIIDPKNPFSKNEWEKQNAVSSIRAKPLTKDEEKEGTLQDKIEIRAEFKDAEAYFALQKYLSYARKELELCYEWMKRSIDRHGLKLRYEWRYIDGSKISTRGFHPRQLSFTLDQNKILKLLTGQTLYNDVSVSIREIIQNSLDAVKLNSYKHSKENILGYSPKIEVHWDESSGILEIFDNGVGMTQDEIESYFLKAGSSKYQMHDFKKKFPEFSPIGRFGIGVLSCFMISDAVEVFTTTDKRDSVRNIKLTDAQSDYLLRDIDRSSDIAKRITDSGTIIRLLIRPSLRKIDFDKLLGKWIKFPFCDIEYFTNGKGSKIGFNNTKDAVKSILDNEGYHVVIAESKDHEIHHGDMKIITHNEDGLDLSYAVTWNKWNSQWEFVNFNQRETNESIELGTYIEGIFVSSGTPGYRNNVFIALANFTGEKSPTTNVARSDFEATPELDRGLEKLYSLYAKHIDDEIKSMSVDKNVSITQAATDARYLVSQLHESNLSQILPIRIDLLRKAVRDINIVILDIEDNRTLTSINKIKQNEQISTVLWSVMDSVNHLASNLNNKLSAAKVIASLGNFPDLPPNIIPTTYLQDKIKINNAFVDREISEIVIHRSIERVDMSWSTLSDKDRWVSLSGAAIRKIIHAESRFGGGRNNLSDFTIINNPSEVSIIGGESIKLITNDNIFYVIQECKLAEHIKEVFTTIENSANDPEIFMSYAIIKLYASLLTTNSGNINEDYIIESLSRRSGNPFSSDQEVASRIISAVKDLENSTLHIGRKNRSFTSRFFGRGWEL